MILKYLFRAPETLPLRPKSGSRPNSGLSFVHIFTLPHYCHTLIVQETVTRQATPSCHPPTPRRPSRASTIPMLQTNLTTGTRGIIKFRCGNVQRSEIYNLSTFHLCQILSCPLVRWCLASINGKKKAKTRPN